MLGAAVTQQPPLETADTVEAMLKTVWPKQPLIAVFSGRLARPH